MTHQSSADIRPDDLLPVNRFTARYPNLATAGSLRWQIFCSAQNGLDEAGAILRRGNRVFINVPRYMDWLTVQSFRQAA